LYHADVNLNAVVQRAVDDAGPLFKEREQEVSVALPGSVLWTHADPTRLAQVAANLLSNAAKYTLEGGQAWVSLQAEADKAVLRVRDTGIGIAPELRGRIFDLFAQGEQPLHCTQAGLGIGLALVKSLVEMHGGTVTAESEGAGRGSEFIVRLPLMASPAQISAPSPEQASPSPHPLRVLFVDDHADARRLSQWLLQAQGHDVRTACDGPSALEVAREFHPDVALLDIGLPGMDGYEVAR
jgi:anti-sigma regulatory factor (Ser/Thr protein kinase)